MFFPFRLHNISETNEYHEREGKRMETKRKRGGQPGNRNAAGSGKSRIRNRNAVKHGGYCSMAYLTEEELQILEDMELVDCEQALIEEISLYSFGERLLMREMQNLRASENEDGLYTAHTETFIKDGRETSIQSEKAVIDLILRLQQVIRRVEHLKVEALVELAKIRHDRRDLEIRQARRELERERTDARVELQDARTEWLQMDPEERKQLERKRRQNFNL